MTTVPRLLRMPTATRPPLSLTLSSALSILLTLLALLTCSAPASAQVADVTLSAKDQRAVRQVAAKADPSRLAAAPLCALYTTKMQTLVRETAAEVLRRPALAEADCAAAMSAMKKALPSLFIHEPIPDSAREVLKSPSSTRAVLIIRWRNEDGNQTTRVVKLQKLSGRWLIDNDVTTTPF